MTAIRVLSGSIPDAVRGGAVFAGDLLVCTRVQGLDAFRSLVVERIRRSFDPLDPETAHARLGSGDWTDRVEALQREVRGDAGIRRRMAGTLAGAGVDRETTCWDWVHLRVQAPRGPDRSPGEIGVHRDTWSSNVYQQVNWWTPLFPVTPDRTVAFWPAYWERELPNSSADWDLEEIRARRRGGEEDVPLVPVPVEPVDRSSEVRMVIEPGNLLCFSGAHLHGSVPNTSERTRFSVEVRTVGVEDVRAGRSAPNVDGRAPRVALGWFRRITDGTPLPDLLGPDGPPATDGPS